ncbi:N-acetylmuramoyl-L-alanine amidase [Neobacillus sp. PS3-34]|uniref:N-acetylmuramoyl-L-alanine amidase family protein n=1 Tax=Neobacillus sp. PS3-34 TaxID=3070678 RepID=UPI0027E051C6|nr:N-acetylmuramoyl-L-alanine amidase [Neobacillus sp. PS3-34]WML46871.1 N-acetylmuramoyl-L-alanine amidase [Neobacillus sp. PS3-34]
MANSIQDKLIDSLGTYDRGVKEQDFYVNRMNALPSVLVEMAYISNPNEETLLRSTTFRQKVATGIRKGLEEYFNNF